jgi:hypothetical protein
LPVFQSFFEFPDAVAQTPADLRQTVRAEKEKAYEKDDE